MSARPLVSVVTGTWQRHDLLLEAIENVRQQTYRPLEHVIVSDGPDEALRHLDRFGAVWQPDGERFVPIIFQELGRQWSEFCPDSISAAPFKVAQFLARGEMQCWLADDERMLVPDYIERMVNTLETEGVDFAYSTVEMWRAGRPQHRWPMGGPTPQCGNITSAFYRSELMRHRMFELHVGSGTDWDQINHWMKAGATWKWIDEPLFEHRIDK